MFGSTVAALLAGDSELVGAVGSQVGDESFGHPSINVNLLPVVLDLWTNVQFDKLFKNRSWQ